MGKKQKYHQQESYYGMSTNRIGIFFFFLGGGGGALLNFIFGVYAWYLGGGGGKQKMLNPSLRIKEN